MDGPKLTKLRRGLVNLHYTYYCGEAVAPQTGTLPLASSADRLLLTPFVRKISSIFPHGDRCAPDFVPRKEREQAIRSSSKRGRKPTRDKTLSGNFSSQMAFYLWFQSAENPEGEEVQAKVFVKNFIHLPKPPTGDFDEADRVVQQLVDYLNASFDGLPGFRPISLGPRLVKLVNCSSRLEIGPRRALNLERIKERLLAHAEAAPLPLVFCSHVCGEAHLTAHLAKPPDAERLSGSRFITVRINLRGKVAIMGDSDFDRIELVYSFLSTVLSDPSIVRSEFV